MATSLHILIPDSAFNAVWYKPGFHIVVIVMNKSFSPMRSK